MDITGTAMIQMHELNAEVHCTENIDPLVGRLSDFNPAHLP